MNNLQNLRSEDDTDCVVNVDTGHFAYGTLESDGEHTVAKIFLDLFPGPGGSFDITISSKDFTSEEEFNQTVADKLSEYSAKAADFLGLDELTESRWQFTDQQVAQGWGKLVAYEASLQEMDNNELISEALSNGSDPAKTDTIRRALAKRMA